MDYSEMKLLICDDSILARKNLKDILNSLGFTNIIETTNGKDAVDRSIEEHPDIIMLDIVMPVMDGVSATKAIIEKMPNAIIIMVSSAGTQTNIKEAIKAGAKDFVQKPIDADLLKQVLSSAINKRS